MRDFFVFTMITKTRPWRHIYHDIEIPRPKNHNIVIPRPKNHDIQIPRPKSHDIEIPRPKNHDIEFLWNSDPCAPRYLFLVQTNSHIFTMMFQQTCSPQINSLGAFTVVNKLLQPARSGVMEFVT